MIILNVLSSCNLNNITKKIHEKQVYIDNLESIKSIVESPNKDSILQVVKLIAYFEDVTSIHSESDGTYIGKFDPTKLDVEKWETWFRKNKSMFK